MDGSPVAISDMMAEVNGTEGTVGALRSGIFRLYAQHTKSKPYI